MSTHTSTRRLNQSDLFRLYHATEKIVMFTCYDASFAKLLEGAGVEAILIGDSLGNVIQGHDTTLPVSLEDVVYHTTCVKRGCHIPFIIADMPFGTFQISPAQTFENAVKLMAAGAQMVKMEGGGEKMAETTRFLVSQGIPVCAHLGLTPQSVHVMGGYKVQGREEAAAEKLKADALRLEEAGATMMVLEAVPAKLAMEITKSLSSVITIGIGAGKDTSGQVLVLHDAIDVPPGKKAKFVKNFMQGAPSIVGAIENAVREIKSGTYPDETHCYSA